MATPRFGPAPDSEQFNRVVEIIARYPAVDEAERELVIHYLRTAPAPAEALLASRAEIGAQLAAFKAEHQRHFEGLPAPALDQPDDPASAHAPTWFRIAVWAGVAVAALILAWFVGSGAETPFEAADE